MFLKTRQYLVDLNARTIYPTPYRTLRECCIAADVYRRKGISLTFISGKRLNQYACYSDFRVEEVKR